MKLKTYKVIDKALAWVLALIYIGLFAGAGILLELIIKLLMGASK